jgi:hypothetical protein
MTRPSTPASRPSPDPRSRGRPRRRPWRPDPRAEDGAAIIEFLAAFLVLVVPLVYGIAIMADVQRAMLATSSAAREVGRVYATAATRAEAAQRSRSAYQDTLANYHYSPTDQRAHLRLDSSCPASAPTTCTDGFGPGAEIRVVVTYQVPIVRIPFLGVIGGPSLTVGATHHTRHDRFRGLA